MSEHNYPEPCVGAVIENRDGKILVMKSPKWNGKYVVPGGHVEMGETVEDAVKREVLEETGLDVYGVEFLQHSEIIYDPDFYKRRHFVMFDFSCKTDGEDVSLSDEGVDHKWLEPEEALSLPLVNATRQMIEKYIESRK